mgnify:FL=1
MQSFVPGDTFALKIQRELSPEMRPKSFGTFEKRVPDLNFSGLLRYTISSVKEVRGLHTLTAIGFGSTNLRDIYADLNKCVQKS